MSGFYSVEDCSLAEFEALIGQELRADSLQFADEVTQNVPVYDAPALAPVLADPDQRRALMSEWAWVLGDRSGIVVIKRAVTDREALDAATAIYEQIIAEERATKTGEDHFAGAGANDRVWNALQKLCLANPEVFARYFASPSIAAVCEAWLGPGYQMTAQINLVRPGGAAQVAHRDYHLGFMSLEEAQDFPVRAHTVSPALTLQGGIAHCDMPIESGPTKLLPFSQAYGPGYLAFHLPEFRDVFERAHVQLPLETGDAIFFSPALFHAAGSNRSASIQRMVNLLQVSSPMGRATEAVDRTAMVRALYPVLASGLLSGAERAAAIAAAAEGYSFPTNLDTDPPVDGLASESQAALMTRALDQAMSPADFEAALDRQNARRQP